MPRQARLDAPGCVHHVVFRGIERRAIFADDIDRADLLARLDRILPEEDVACFGWVLMDNHVHLLLRTGSRPLGSAMRRVTTGYAQRFNRRHGRAGYLLQSRFFSRVVADDDELRVVLRYVHRNPLRAGRVPSMRELDVWPWSGHSALIGSVPARRFHDVRRTRALFGSTATAIARLEEWMAPGPVPVPNAAPGPAEAHALDRLEAHIAEAGLRFGVTERALASVDRDRFVARARRWLVRTACDDGIAHALIAGRLGVSAGWVSATALSCRHEPNQADTEPTHRGVASDLHGRRGEGDCA